MHQPTPPRTKRVELKLTPAEYEHIRSIAISNGLPMALYIRGILLGRFALPATSTGIQLSQGGD